MSIKSLLMPFISQRLLSQARQDKLRARAERARQAAGARHQVHYFHQVDDPYSALAAAVLPLLTKRYDIEILAHVVGAPPDAAAPERAKLVAYSRKDAALLARRFGEDSWIPGQAGNDGIPTGNDSIPTGNDSIPTGNDRVNLRFVDAGAQPAEALVAQTAARLVAAINAGRFVELAGQVSEHLWDRAMAQGDVAAQAIESDATALAPTMAMDAPDSAPFFAPPRADTPDAVNAHVDASNALRQRLGHYLGAMFFYGGEWYWGIDRLHHLERRLQALGAVHGGATGLMFPPDDGLCESLRETVNEPSRNAESPAIDFFVSLRSPYSAIVAPRVFELGRLSGAAVNIRYVLPMVMRGLPVPREKRSYIGLDTAREARLRGIAFGRVNDPLGRPTERGIAVLALAERQGKVQEYLLSFMRGVWAEGIDAGSDRGLRRIAERAGLVWADAREALQDEAWRKTAEANRAEMFGLGLWGVPSFRVGATAVWGQDRLWAVQDALRAMTK